jgi:hypothetical protein
VVRGSVLLWKQDNIRVAKFPRLCPLVLSAKVRRRRHRELENEVGKVMRSGLFEYAAGDRSSALELNLEAVGLCIWRTALRRNFDNNGMNAFERKWWDT